MLKVPRLLPKLVRLPLPVALRLPALVNTAPPPTWMALLPLQTALVLLLVKLRALRIRFCVVVSRVSAVPTGTVVEPAPLIVPPDHTRLLSTVSAPAPVSVPLVVSTRLSMLVAAASDNVPPATVKVPAPAMSAPALSVCVALRLTAAPAAST